jgi:glutamate-ammonia-ligase adenylyltransferase
MSRRPEAVRLSSDASGTQAATQAVTGRLGQEIAAASGLSVEVVAEAAQYAAEPSLALGRVLDLPEGAASLAGLERAERIALLSLLGGSAHLSRVVRSDPDWRAWLREEMLRVTEGPRGTDDLPIPLPVGILDDQRDAAAVLRHFRQAAFLRIGARDLWGVVTLEETLASLTAVAEAAIDAATACARRELEADYGPLEIEPSRPNRFVVLGMGKLGARELNYSSDVDLVFLYETDGTPSRGGRRGSLAPREFATRIGERIMRLLAEVTDLGFVFRVDLRLRPDGMNGPLTNSLSSTLAYYEAMGQTWERAALFKARPVAGQLDLGRELLAELAPFIYRRTLDYTMIADLEHMKARVEEQVRRTGRSELDVKLGPGGIRELEFLVQSFSLVHGGRERSLREPGTLRALPVLVERGMLDAPEGRALAAAYRWLRRVEHTLQIDEDRQVHTLPDGEEAREIVARRLGLHLAGEGPIWTRALGADTLARFDTLHAEHTGIVRRAFAELFRSRREQTTASADRAVRVLIDELDAPDAASRVAELGFQRPEDAIAALRVLRDGPPHERASAESRRQVRALAPALVDAARRSVAPDRALANLSQFMAGVGARRTFTALLAENPATVRLLINLFATSEYLSRVFMTRPELLDGLVRSDLAVASKDRARLEHELSATLAEAESFEERLDLLRRFRNDEFLRIGIHDIEGELHYTQVSAQLSDLADVCLGKAYDIAVEERRARYGAPAGLHLAVIAMGKLGGGELNYHSDLDLIFVYGPELDRAGSEEEPPSGSSLAPQEFFSKVAQLMMLVLQLATREGYVYKIDTRLRPSGRSGPLVTSLDGFASYHANSSAVWERQALVRARVVSGPEPLKRQIEQIIERFVYGRGLEPAELAEIARVRARMERELARESKRSYHLKVGRGGLTDIEFVAQALALSHGRDHPTLRQRATRPLIDALGAAGLLDTADHAILADAYSFLRALESRLRIEGDQPIERIPRDPIALASAARRMGYADGGAAAAGQQLLEEYERQREAVRDVYQRLVGRWAED